MKHPLLKRELLAHGHRDHHIKEGKSFINQTLDSCKAKIGVFLENEEEKAIA